MADETIIRRAAERESLFGTRQHWRPSQARADTSSAIEARECD